MATFSAAFATAFQAVIGEEGGFTRNPSDPGNWTGGVAYVGILRGTKYGISARAFPTLDIATLTLDQARVIYCTRYWTPLAGDALPYAVALLAFDAAVNQGLSFAAHALQRAIPVVQDGVIGVDTIHGACACDRAQLALRYAVLRLQAYANDDGFSLFGAGWFRRLLTVFLLAQPSPGDTHD